MADKALTKKCLQLQQKMNRLAKLVPGNSRRWELENIIARLEADRDLAVGNLLDEDYEIAPGVIDSIVEGQDRDILFLNRLAWDLHAARLTLSPLKRGGRSGNADPLGERP